MAGDNKTATAGWVLAIVRTLDEQRVDSKQLLRELDINPEHLESLDFRIENDQITQLWHRAVELTGDETLGLKVAAHLRSPNLHLVGHMMACSASLLEALLRYIRFRHIVGGVLTMDLHEDADSYQLHVEGKTDELRTSRQACDAFLGSIVMIFRWLADDVSLAPSACYIPYSHPSDESDYRALFQCPLYFDQPQAQLHFPKELLNTRIATANDQLAVLLDSLALDYLSRMQEGKFTQQVRLALTPLLVKGKPTKEAVANALHISQRTLLRRLQDENTNYMEVLDHLRMELAYGYLKRDDVTLEEATYMLGYSDVSTFSRAFKGWSGKSPGRWREQSG